MRDKTKKIKDLMMLPSFTVDMAAKLGVSKLDLSRMAKAGSLERVCRGIYFDPNFDIGVEIQYEDLIRSIYHLSDGAVCLVSALYIHDLTDEIPRLHWYAYPHEKRIPKIPSLKIVRMRNIDFGVTKIALGNYSIRVTDMERTVVDTFRYFDHEIAIISLRRCLKNGGSIPVLLKYAKTLRIDIKTFIKVVTTE